MFNEEKLKIIDAGKKLDKYNLIALSGGNVSWRMPAGEILVTPSGMIYDDMVENDVLVMNIEGSIIEGNRRPSVDTAALLYIYKHMPEVNAIIHTHQPYATAMGLLVDEIPPHVTTMVNGVKGSVKVAPFSSAASLDMGVKAVENLGGRLAVILKHHGVITVGKDLKEALYACVYLEEACKTMLAAMNIDRNIPALNEEQINGAILAFEDYGQEKAESSISYFGRTTK